jgi:hypothetical protein
MDKWKDTELKKMKVGGNQNAREFFEEEEESEFLTVCEWQRMNLTILLLFRLGHDVDPSEIQQQSCRALS